MFDTVSATNKTPVPVNPPSDFFISPEHLELIRKIASRYRFSGLRQKELQSEGVFALLKAAKRYDPSRGASFTTYASRLIRQHLRIAIAEQTKIFKMSVEDSSLMRQIRELRKTVSPDFPRGVPDSEISIILGVTERVIKHLMKHDHAVVSFNQPIDGDGKNTYEDVIADSEKTRPDRIISDFDSAARLAGATKLLGEKELKVIQMRFGLDGNSPRTLEEIAAELGITKERVRQIESRAFEKMRKHYDIL